MKFMRKTNVHHSVECLESKKKKKQFVLGISCLFCSLTYNETQFYFYLAQLNNGTDNFHIQIFGKNTKQ